MFNDNIQHFGSIDLALDSDFEKFFGEYVTQLGNIPQEQNQTQKQPINVENLEQQKQMCFCDSGVQCNPGVQVGNNNFQKRDPQLFLQRQMLEQQQQDLIQSWTMNQNVQCSNSQQVPQGQFFSSSLHHVAHLQPTPSFQLPQTYSSQNNNNQQSLPIQQSAFELLTGQMQFGSVLSQQQQQLQLQDQSVTINQKINENQVMMKIERDQCGSNSKSLSNEQDPGSRSDDKDSRHKAVLEKNRRAQKKFRDKQKSKLNDLEREIEKLQKENHELSQINSQLVSQNDILLTVLKLRDKRIEFLLQGSGQAKEIPEDKIVVLPNCKVQKKEDLGCSYAEARDMKGAEVIQRWKCSVMKVSDLLVKAEGPNPPKEAVEQLEEEVHSVMGLCAKVAVLNPNGILMLLSVNLETTNPNQRPQEEQDHWNKVIRSIQLSTEQKLSIVQHWKNLLKEQVEVREERQMLNQELVSLLPQIVKDNLSLASQKGDAWCLTLAVSDARNTIQSLRFNLERSHDRCTEFAMAVFSEVLLPKQIAKAMVQSYPYYPDVFFMGAILEDEFEENGKKFPEGNEFVRGCLIVTSGVPQ